MKIAAATCYPGLKDDHFVSDGIEYFVVAQRKRNCFAFEKHALSTCATLVKGWRPDVVHIHGSERFYGLLASDPSIETPIVVSLQGLLGPYLQFFYGALSARQIIACGLADLLLGRGLLVEWYRLWKGARRETKVLQTAKHFLGRTLWDRSHLRSTNPTATYDQVGEVLRQAFYQARWQLNHCKRFRVFMTNWSEPRRGTDVVLRSIAALRPYFPNIELVIAGSPRRYGYARSVRRAAKSADLAGAVRFLGFADADQLARELVQAHVYVCASFIENSPNSLCEALLVGVPCVASYTGGIPSLIADNRTGLLFPVGDSAVLAERIRQIFTEPELAAEISSAARAEALRRHDPQGITSTLIAAYERVAQYQTDNIPATGVPHSQQTSSFSRGAVRKISTEPSLYLPQEE
jgi:glycosyltransferase involved in cell wall biosynthesis